HIDAVEMMAEDALQATENVEASPWKDRVKVHHRAIQNFRPQIKYDLIVTNPPFFIGSQAPPDQKRYQARHTVTLTYEDIIDCIMRLLADSGRFNVILPFTEGLQFISDARNHGLFCTRRFTFKSKKEKPAERWLLEFALRERVTETGEIILYDNQNQWSAEYRKLT